MSTTTVPARRDSQLTFFTKVSYGLGDLASQLIWSFTGGYLSVFFTDVVGLAPAVVAVILLGARIWDGINDPMFGAIAERTQTKWGRFRPYIIFGTPVLALLNVLVFTNPGFGGNMNMRIAYAAISYIVLGMTYTVVSLSYGSLQTVMSTDATDRTELASYRMIGTQVGNIVLNLIAGTMIMYFSGGTGEDGEAKSALGYTLTAVIFAVIATALLYIMVWRCRENVKVAPAKTRVPLATTVKVVLTNKPLLIVFAIMLFSMTAMFGRLGVAIYYFMYSMHRFDLIALLMMLPSITTAVGIAVMAKFVDRIGKKRAAIIGYAIAGLALVAMYFTDPANATMIIVWTAVYGLGFFVIPIPIAMVPEAIDYAEDRTGVRADGTSYATVSLATKFASAIGGAGGLLIMGAFGYIANAEQTPEAITGINIAVNLFPVLCLVLAGVAVAAYPLTPDKNAAIRASLDSKAAESVTPAGPVAMR
jgi:GPH family glycoside/pentoside/hexuronide:cation symporter/probable glucitol transport protein GutA